MSFTTQQILTKVDALVAAFAAATGTNVAAKTITNANDTVEAGYYEATTLATVDPNLASANIKSGATIFGVPGDSNVVDTTEQTDGATSADIAAGKFAWVNGVRVEGVA